MSDDLWELSSGLIDDFDLAVTEAFFTTDAKYNNGQTLLLKLVGTTDDADTPQVEQYYTCGATESWEAANGGANAKRVDGKSTSFNKTSGIGQLIGAAVEVGAGDDLRARGNPTEAGIWAGLTFHMKRQKVGQGEYATERLLPTEYKGANGAAPASNGSAASAASSNGASSKVIEAKLKSLAKTCDSHDAFIDKAFQMEGVEGNAEAEALVVDEGFYTAARA